MRKDDTNEHTDSDKHTLHARGMGKPQRPQMYVRETCNFREMAARGPVLSTERTVVFPKR